MLRYSFFKIQFRLQGLDLSFFTWGRSGNFPVLPINGFCKGHQPIIFTEKKILFIVARRRRRRRRRRSISESNGRRGDIIAMLSLRLQGLVLSFSLFLLSNMIFYWGTMENVRYVSVRSSKIQCTNQWFFSRAITQS